MKKSLVTVSSLAVFTCVTFGEPLSSAELQMETERIAKMSEALQTLPIEAFMLAARTNNTYWMPWMPSKSFIDTKIPDENTKHLMRIYRDFGHKMALRLDDLAKEQQTLPQDDALYQRTMLLCDMSERLTTVAGYGNFFLAQRCLDLATIGLTRLAASEEFSIEKCEEIADRMNQKWQGMLYLMSREDARDMGDDAKGFEWLKQSAEQGNTHSQRIIGMCYERGVGVTRDIDEAKRKEQEVMDETSPSVIAEAAGVTTRDKKQSYHWLYVIVWLFAAIAIGTVARKTTNRKR